MLIYYMRLSRQGRKRKEFHVAEDARSKNRLRLVPGPNPLVALVEERSPALLALGSDQILRSRDHYLSSFLLLSPGALMSLHMRARQSKQDMILKISPLSEGSGWITESSRKQPFSISILYHRQGVKLYTSQLLTQKKNAWELEHK